MKELARPSITALGIAASTTSIEPAGTWHVRVYTGPEVTDFATSAHVFVDGATRPR